MTKLKSKNILNNVIGDGSSQLLSPVFLTLSVVLYIAFAVAALAYTGSAAAVAVEDCGSFAKIACATAGSVALVAFVVAEAAALCALTVLAAVAFTLSGSVAARALGIGSVTLIAGKSSAAVAVPALSVTA